jgi:hypothetical protein
MQGLTLMCHILYFVNICNYDAIDLHTSLYPKLQFHKVFVHYIKNNVRNDIINPKNRGKSSKTLQQATFANSLADLPCLRKSNYQSSNSVRFAILYKQFLLTGTVAFLLSEFDCSNGHVVMVIIKLARAFG